MVHQYISSEQPEAQGEKDISNHSEFDSMMAQQFYKTTQYKVFAELFSKSDRFFSKSDRPPLAIHICVCYNDTKGHYTQIAKKVKDHEKTSYACADGSDAFVMCSIRFC